MSTMNTYCLFCTSGQEQEICQRLEHLGYIALSPQVVRHKPAGKATHKKLVRLIPGYIFFDADSSLEPDWREIRRFPHLLRILRYGDGQLALRGADLAFVAWLKRFSGVIQISSVIQVGTKIRIIDGPLKDMGGRIIKVNKNRKVVQVSFGETEGLINTIWCSIDYVQMEANEKDVLKAVLGAGGAQF